MQITYAKFKRKSSRVSKVKITSIELNDGSFLEQILSDEDGTNAHMQPISREPYSVHYHHFND